MLRAAIKNLIMGLEQGVDRQTYDGICGVLAAVLGSSAVVVLDEKIQHPQHRYLLADAEEVWQQLRRFF